MTGAAAPGGGRLKGVSHRTTLRAAALVAVAVTGLAAPVTGTAARSVQLAEVIRVELAPATGSELAVDGRTYGGTLSVSLHGNGLALVEDVALDAYLAGIREVPLSWPAETLKAQAVAARTYLAWTLAGGRSRDGRSYGFDICATTQCQVYAGTGVVRQPDGDRWLEAIAATHDEILIHDGSPAQTLYSASAGTRTRPVQDIWGGDAKPYLVAVDSPEAGVTPYESWELTVDVETMRRIIAHGGVFIGSDVRTVAVDRPPEGHGPSVVVVESGSGRVSIPVTTVRAAFNQFGPVLYPGLFPAQRPGGGRWPQTFLSYTFDVVLEPGTPPAPAGPIPTQDLPGAGVVIFRGEGWGHGVGMSQWGAKAMGDLEFGYDDILGHYYGGLEPRDGGAAIPDTVRVGLRWAAPAIVVEATGLFELRINGVPAGVYGRGQWMFAAGREGIRIVPPQSVRTALAWTGHRRWPR